MAEFKVSTLSFDFVEILGPPNRALFSRREIGSFLYENLGVLHPASDVEAASSSPDNYIFSVQTPRQERTLAQLIWFVNSLKPLRECVSRFRNLILHCSFRNRHAVHLKESRCRFEDPLLFGSIASNRDILPFKLIARAP